jgi:hypothetical protein
MLRFVAGSPAGTSGVDAAARNRETLRVIATVVLPSARDSDTESSRGATDVSWDAVEVGCVESDVS